MRGDNEMPHVQIMENGPEGLKMGTMYNLRTQCINTVQALNGVKLPNDYYIFTLEWTRDRMVWKINDTVVKEINEGVPDTPMYIGFSLGTTSEPSERMVPAVMEIGWVRFYKMKD